LLFPLCKNPTERYDKKLSAQFPRNKVE
jgi:hypothetical protein